LAKWISLTEDDSQSDVIHVNIDRAVMMRRLSHSGGEYTRIYFSSEGKDGINVKESRKQIIDLASK
jgi:hypothetical protein